jgi:hypothetical protein
VEEEVEDGLTVDDEVEDGLMLDDDEFTTKSGDDDDDDEVLKLLIKYIHDEHIQHIKNDTIIIMTMLFEGFFIYILITIYL